METFFQLNKKERDKLFSRLRENKNMSWEEFYSKYNISKTMFFNYISGRYAIPERLFKIWKNLSKTKIIAHKIQKQKFIRKKIPLFKIDERLAEIFGILNGDGHISKFKYEICTVGDAKEKDYLNYIKKLFEEKFGLPFTFYFEPTRIKLRIYSKDLSRILVDKYNFPLGNKLGKLKIPKILYSSNKLLSSYIRGLFDTDGSIYIRRRKDMVINISSADKKFLNEVRNVLKMLGFNASLSGKNLFLYHKNEIEKFFKIIKPANSKHLKKYQNYLKLLRG